MRGPPSPIGNRFHESVAVHILSYSSMVEIQVKQERPEYYEDLLGDRLPFVLCLCGLSDSGSVNAEYG